VIVVPSTFKLIRKVADLVRVLPTFVFRVIENAVRRKWNIPQFCSASLTTEAAKKRSVFVVYYESMKREIKTKPIFVRRHNERLKPKGEESTCLTYTGMLREL
jgi:hypothetical protein